MRLRILSRYRGRRLTLLARYDKEGNVDRAIANLNER